MKFVFDVGVSKRVETWLTETGHDVKAIRNIELAISGSGKKEPSSSELKNKPVVRKSIYTAKPVVAGQTILEEDLITLRPGDGISPMDWDEVIGKKVKMDLPAFHKLNRDDIQCK